jgi:hypothetical protein
MTCHLVLRIFLALHQLSARKDNLTLNEAAVLYELIESGAATLNLLQEQERQHQLPGEVIVDFVIMLDDWIELAQGFLRATLDQFHRDDNTYHLPYILRGSLDTT